MLFISKQAVVIAFYRFIVVSNLFHSLPPLRFHDCMLAGSLLYVKMTMSWVHVKWEETLKALSKTVGYIIRHSYGILMH